MSIEKFTGNFSKEDGGVSIMINKTVQSLTNGTMCAVYCYLLTKPNDWKINPQEIMTHFKVGKGKVYPALKGLIELKLLKRDEIREKGKIVRYDYTLFLKPYINITHEPLPDLPHAALSHTENTHYTKKRDLQNKEVTKNTISETNVSPSAIKQQIQTQEIIDISNQVCPEWPEIRKIDDKFKNKIIKMRKEWPSYAGNEFTIEAWREFLLTLKKLHGWMFQPYQKKSGKMGKWSLRTLVQPEQLAKIRNGEYNDFNNN